jgi:hypothetical protein
MTLYDARTTTLGYTDARAVRIIDEDPELPNGVPADQLERLRHMSVAAVIELQRGPVITALPRIPHGSFGFLILDGVLAAGMRLGTRLTLELLGPTDLTGQVLGGPSVPSRLWGWTSPP